MMGLVLIVHFPDHYLSFDGGRFIGLHNTTRVLRIGPYWS